MGPVISAENLTKRYGSLLAVDTISFSVRRGEVFGFLGTQWSRKDDDHEDDPVHLSQNQRPSHCL